MQAPFVRRWTRPLLLASVGAVLTACASVPHLGSAPEPKLASAYAANQSFDAAAADWPSDRWWTAYGDAQLDMLIDAALKDSPDLAMAQARLRKAEALAQVTGSVLGPHATALAAVAEQKQSYNNGIPRAIVPQGWNDTGLVGAGLDWQLDLFGKNRARLAAATSESEAARADAAFVRLTLSTSIAAAYADLAQLYADRDAAEDALRVRRDGERLITARCAQGLETLAAQERAHAARAGAEAELATLDEAVGLTRNRIAALMGQGPDRGLAIGRPAPNASAPSASRRTCRRS